ncbi:MAG: 2-C-methyl-D-erythritol 4-phosphate cytidylyltransferase [Treponema sp.]|nr:2-C-methyl-D-erythritol 4-phosphate cytidylyltransferase [Treponema sp.]
MNGVIILAGGISERLSEIGIPKQYYPVEKPIILYSLLCFQKSNEISKIIIVADSKWQPKLTELIYKNNISKFIKFASPGRTRQLSIYNGLKGYKNLLSYDDYIIIHDGVRPFVTESDIENVIISSNGFDGSTPVISLTDTVYQSADGILINKLLKRNELYAGQTPECYIFGKYLFIHESLTDDLICNYNGSSEIAFNNQMKIKLCKGNINNIKITTMSDLEYFIFKINKDEL